MKFKAPLTIAGVVLFGAFATGCSQQQTADSSQNVDSSQNADEAPAAPAAPAKPTGANCHNHPENASRGATSHCHPFTDPNHHHTYGGGNANTGGANVADLQNRLKAKGYYKGSITGVMDADTKSALQSYQAAH